MAKAVRNTFNLHARHETVSPDDLYLAVRAHLVNEITGTHPDDSDYDSDDDDERMDDCDWEEQGIALAAVGIDHLSHTVSETGRDEAVYYYMGMALIDMANERAHDSVPALYAGMRTGPLFNVLPFYPALEPLMDIAMIDLEDMLCYALQRGQWREATGVLETLATRDGRPCMKDAVYFVAEHQATRMPLTTLALLYMCMKQDCNHTIRTWAIVSDRFFRDVKIAAGSRGSSTEMSVEMFAAKRRLDKD